MPFKIHKASARAVLALLLLSAGGCATTQGAHGSAADRGLVASGGEGGYLVSWRKYAADPAETRFLLYRDGQLLTPEPVGLTNFHDAGGTPQSRYSLAVVQGGQTKRLDRPALMATGGYLSIPLDQPEPRVAPDGTSYSYEANDASVGDLDGDGVNEIIVKWYPSIAKDNAFAGYSGNTLFDAYTLDGRKLWRIDMGPNIRSGAHYTQFMVFDFDGDGRAELAMKTADGTIDGTGKVIGDPKADWVEAGGAEPSGDRTGSTETPDGKRVAQLKGRILKGPEFLSVFDGRTGKVLATAPYDPPRHPETDNPTGEQLKEIWGDGYANRSDRYLAGVAYLDGKLPSIVMARGYYTRSVLAAWDWRDGKLTKRWTFDSAVPGNEKFGGQGNHQLSVADVDNDGRDEIIYGSMAVDDDGKGLWSAALLHGDAMHVSDLDPTRPGLERWGVHEVPSRNGGIGGAMLDARTGELLWSTPTDKDTGRGLAADIDPRFPGAEAWGSNSGELFTAQGKAIGPRPRQMNFAIWWDGDLSRELLDGTRVFKWDYEKGESVPLLAPVGLSSNNGTKSTPALSADLLGDWREEVIWRTADNKALRIYVTPIPTEYALPTLMDDRAYRLAIAWQNTAYNQPPHPSYFLGTGMQLPPK